MKYQKLKLVIWSKWSVWWTDPDWWAMVQSVQRTVHMYLLCTSLYTLQTTIFNFWYFILIITSFYFIINPLAPNDVYISRTAQLTSRRCILNIYSTNILTEYFKHAAHSPFFSLQDAVYFIMLSFLVPVIFTF